MARLVRVGVVGLVPAVFGGMAWGAPTPDEAFADGKALGQGLIGPSLGALQDGSAAATVPNYTDQPPQRAYYRSGDLATPAQAEQSRCARTPADPVCAGVVQGRATRPPNPVTLADPALAADGVTRDPALVLGDIANTYNACTVGEARLLTPAVFERRVCLLDTQAWTAHTCDKTLTVYTQDQYSCQEGTWYAAASGTVASAGAVRVEALCQTARVDRRMRFKVTAVGTSQEFELDMGLATPPLVPGTVPPRVAALRSINGRRLVDVYAEGPGCGPDGACAMGFWFFAGERLCIPTGGGGTDCSRSIAPGHFEPRMTCPPAERPGNELLFLGTDGAWALGNPATCWRSNSGGIAARIYATGAADTVVESGPASPTTAYWAVAGAGQTRLDLHMAKPAIDHVAGDYWDNACAGYEAQTSPLPGDGVNPDPAPDLPVLSQLATDQCQRSSSVCVDGPSTRIVEGEEVTRPCWQWHNTFDCTTLADTSTCTDPAWRACSQAGAAQCLHSDGLGHCLSSQAAMDCQVTGAVYETPLNCGPASFCAGGSCYDRSYANDADFAQAITMLEAQRETGRYFDPQTMRIFQGTDDRCDVEIWGLKDCCEPGGTDALSAFNTLSVAADAVAMVGKAAFSTYTYDALFTSQAPNWVLSSFEGLFGTGLDSGLMGVLSGNLAVGDFMMSLVPGPWQVAMLIIQFSGLMDCPVDDQNTAMKKDARLCHAVGDYCSDKDLFGGCITRTYTTCCYPSRLARIINEQGRPQLARGWGTSRRPECAGFTIDELQSLDFSVMDLSEFYREVVPTAADLDALQSQAINKQMQCYYGGGACGP